MAFLYVQLAVLERSPLQNALCQDWAEISFLFFLDILSVDFLPSWHMGGCVGLRSTEVNAFE